MVYLTAIGLTPGSNSTVHIYTQTTHRQHNRHKQYTIDTNKERKQCLHLQSKATPRYVAGRFFLDWLIIIYQLTRRHFRKIFYLTTPSVAKIMQRGWDKLI
jgi:hypothetical protein